MCVKNNTIVYVERVSNSKRDCEYNLYCCLLPRCEALRICRSGFPIATEPIRAQCLGRGCLSLQTLSRIDYYQRSVCQEVCCICEDMCSAAAVVHNLWCASSFHVMFEIGVNEFFYDFKSPYNSMLLTVN